MKTETGLSLDVRCRCNVCSEEIEFDLNGIGKTVECPHCGMETLLYDSSRQIVETKKEMVAPAAEPTISDPTRVEIVRDREEDGRWAILSIVGYLLLVCGFLGMTFAWSRSTDAELVHNAGLLNDRLVIMVAWSSVLVVGALFIIAGKLTGILQELRKI